MSETLAITENIPQARPGAFFDEHRDEALAAITRVMDSGWYILGREVQAFENEFAQHFGFGAAAGVGNGTDAIALALRALGVGPGDLVATVAHTAIATVAAIEMVDAIPILIDIDPVTYTMDPESLARTIDAHGPIKAVIVVHLYGNIADMPSLLRLARQSSAYLIEDCAQAHGATLDGHFAGSMSDVAAFSFYPTKNLGALGDGGIVAAVDPAYIDRVRALREYGWQQRYISERSGINSRLDELQAAVLRIRLPYLHSANRRRVAIAAAYDKGLANTGLGLPASRAGVGHVYHQYVVRHPQRDAFQSRLKSKGIGTNIHYPIPAHRQPAYAGRIAIDPQGLQATDAVVSEILSLPIYPELSDEAVDMVIDAVRSAMN